MNRFSTTPDAMLIAWCAQYSVINPTFSMDLIERWAEKLRNTGKLDAGEREYLEFLVIKHKMVKVYFEDLNKKDQLKVLLYKELLNYDPNMLPLEDKFILFKLQEHALIQDIINTDQ